MPEGDTIVRTARTLQRAIGGQHITSFETVLPRLSRVDEDSPLIGRVVESVEAEGKWLLTRFSGDLILLTHMLMSGSWHIYRPGERWQRGRSHMRIVIGTPAMLAVAFDVPIAEFHTAQTLARRRGFSNLGPAVLTGDFDAERAVENLASRRDLGIGAALMNQSLLAGVGNVFKSEICFVCGIHPFRKVDSLTHGELGELAAAARRLMSENVTTDSGTTSSLFPAYDIRRIDPIRIRICGFIKGAGSRAEGVARRLNRKKTVTTRASRSGVPRARP